MNLKMMKTENFKLPCPHFFSKEQLIVMSLHAICVVYKGEIFSLVPHV
jgi:hypothetical protein